MRTKMPLCVFNIASVLVFLHVLHVCPVTAFSVDDCMPNQQNNVVHVTEAQISPSRIVAPGSVLANVNLDILQNITSDLELSVIVRRKVWFVWITVIRSTHNLCGVLDTEFLEVDGTTTCPPQLSNARIPCRCPFARGRYSLPWSSFDVIKPARILYGRYWVKARLRDPNTGVWKACYIVNFDLSRN
ncbi:ganglioside GM2 activator-like [Ylistrum balloti]|uniref:ganglioside GM2 activator-like n=1 Tax=Ylistrum balloti TaxID=509963 RepID=UPI002905B4C0|nr:ganglioside GM2 activator-like [Ylistrum balloti]